MEKVEIGLICRQYAESDPVRDGRLWSESPPRQRQLLKVRINSISEDETVRRLVLGRNDIKPEYKETLIFAAGHVLVLAWKECGKEWVGSEALIGDTKPILLGQYMYDFGGRNRCPVN